ncbi:MAG: RidA family protein [Ignavibacteriaceae bacterium]|jgi:enamine deaminase RidA (YjgF/YER057c/UK114 family)|nr:RidA family protein [Ignavibacteriaceae bacterium]
MIEEKISDFGFELPDLVKPLASYIPAKQVGNLVMTSGQVPIVKGELKYAGKIGKDLTIEQGQAAARVCVLNCLAAIKSVAGSLDRIDEILKLTVFVSSADGFYSQPQVANGASDLIVQIFGENGKHVRSAIGVNSLPLNSAVEIEMIVRISN